MNPLSYTYTMKGAGSSRLTIILRILCMMATVILIIRTATIACGAGGRGAAETATEEIESQAAHEEEQDHDKEIVPEVYDLIREGSEDELRLACEQRGLSTEGDLSTLRKRLLQSEMERKLPPFEVKQRNLTDTAFVLNNADFIRFTKSEEGDELILLRGNVDILHGDREIIADEVTINTSSEIVSGWGNVRITIGSNTFLGESFLLNDASKEMFFFNARAKLDAFHYSGSVIHKIQGEDKYVVYDVSLSTGDIKNLHYWVEAEKLSYFSDEEKVLIKNASIYYGQDDLIRLPFIYRRLYEKKLRTAIYFRTRSGLVWQNTYMPYKTDEREIILKGDLYERLGVYTGLVYNAGDDTAIDLSVAFAKDVYRYPNPDNPSNVTEDWSNLGPPDASEYGTNWSIRYKEALYKKFEFGTGYTNTTEINFLIISDPYYEYDYERRSIGFDFFQFINQAQLDTPTKGSGYTWSLNNYFVSGNFDWYVRAAARFEPQRNPNESYSSLNDYYLYQRYSITAPQTGIQYSETLFQESDSEVLSDMDMSVSADYAYTLYYNPDESLSSRLHKTSGDVGVEKPYQFGSLLRFTPNLIAGGRGQFHIDPTPEQTQQDYANTMLYGQIITDWLFGPDAVYFDVMHNLRYKLAGPDDGFTYNRFRIHEITMAGYGSVWHFSNTLSTIYDLRPTYNWSTGQYDPFVWDSSHFQPLRNTFVFDPADQFELQDVLVYDIVNSRFQTNEFSMGVKSPDWYIRKHHFYVTWDLVWHHNFITPRADELRSIFRIDADIHRYWKVYLRTLSLNENMWRYYSSETENPINPAVDLLKSFNFFNTEDRKASNFKLKTISFGFVRDLHEWELIFDYTGRRELIPNGTTYYWEQTFSISLGLKQVEGVRIHTSVDRASY